MVAEDRIAALEARVAALEGAVKPLGGAAAAARGRAARRAGRRRRATSIHPAAGRATRHPLVRRRAAPAGARPDDGAAPAPAPRAPARARPAAPKRDLEDFLGGSVLAWLGGVAVLAGLAFLLTIAVSRGWIGEGARTALAGRALARPARRRRVAARAARRATRPRWPRRPSASPAASRTLFVAGPVYDLVPRDVALLGALVVGGAATALSIRWHAQVMGWLGLLGALWAPAVLGCGDGTEHVFLRDRLHRDRSPCSSGGAGRCSRASPSPARRSQWAAFVGDGQRAARARALRRCSPPRSRSASRPTAAALHRGRDRPARRARARRGSPRRVLVISAALLALAGWFALDGELWLTALAVAHIAARPRRHPLHRASRASSR